MRGYRYAAASGARGVSSIFRRVIGSAKLPGVDSLPGPLTVVPLGRSGIIVAAFAISSAAIALRTLSTSPVAFFLTLAKRLAVVIPNIPRADTSAAHSLLLPYSVMLQTPAPRTQTLRSPVTSWTLSPLIIGKILA